MIFFLASLSISSNYLPIPNYEFSLIIIIISTVITTATTKEYVRGILL